MKNSRKGLAVASLIVFTVLMIGGGLYYYTKGNWHSFNIGGNVKTSAWKTYRNDKYGLEFKYPQDWSNLYPDGYGNDDALTGDKFTTVFQKDVNIPNIQFFVIDVSKVDPDKHGRSSCIENEMGCPSYSVIKIYSIGDYRARVVNYGGEGGASTFVDVFRGDFVYRFLVPGRDSSLIEKIASTLEFTSPLVYVLGNSSIQYPSNVDTVSYSGIVEFHFTTKYPSTALKNVYIRMGGLGNTIPSGEYIEMNGIRWTRFETNKEVPSEVAEIGLNKNVYIREISYGFCETGCAGATLTMIALDQEALRSDEAKQFISIFEKMMATYRYPITL